RTPVTCKNFITRLPLEGVLLQARWSGEAAWVPLGDFDLGVGLEDPTGFPQVGEILFYPAGISESEILIPYGTCRFSSKAGPLAGNPLMTIVDGLNLLERVGELV